MKDHFIVTYTGKTFRFRNREHIDQDSIEIVDIAHALSHLCRFTGHTNMFWSVAQHSLLMAERIPGPPKLRLAALLHDAAEAYTNDLASPLKDYLAFCDNEYSSAYGYLQNNIDNAVREKFGLGSSDWLGWRDVRLYDKAACVYEAEGFMGLSGEELRRFGYPTELRTLWKPWDPKEFAAKNGDQEFGEIETRFLKQFETLMKACGREHLI